MQNKLKLIVVSCVLLILSTALFCQTTALSIPDSTFIKMKEHAQTALGYLYDNHINAYDYVGWDCLVLNDYDYSDDYWDAYDYEEEDYFIEDMIAYISNSLKTTGVDDSVFTDWSFDKGPDYIWSRCHNNNKSISMKIRNSSYGFIYISEINIKDLVKN